MEHEFPQLFGSEKNGKVKVWSALVSCKDGIATSTITYGQVDGKKQIVTREYTSGKNKGKSNETTPYQQCFIETERKWKDKHEKENYVTKDEEKDENNNKIFPMLASTYSIDSTKKNDITYPCLAQPKLDGLRCIMYMRNGVVLAQSRAGSYFESISFLTESMSYLFMHNPFLVLDGELYTMDIPFETLAGLLKKKKISNTDNALLEKHVKYHIYDKVDSESLTFDKRWNHLQTLQLNQYTRLVNTVLLSSVKEFQSYFSLFIEQGYEGIMLRNTKGMYRQGYRSHDLQKYKEFKEDEYPIIGFEEGDGRDKGCVIWVCCNENKKEFRVRPRGTLEQRREWFQDGNKYIGKNITVIFQELSEQNIPRFPVGKAIRDGY